MPVKTSNDSACGLDGVSIRGIERIRKSCYEVIAVIATMMRKWNIVQVSLGIWAQILLNVRRKDYKTETLNKPPGPWGLPVLGHLFFFGKNPAVTFMKWAKVYGPIFSIRFGGIPAVVLNDAKMIKEAFNLENFSGRINIRNFTKPCDMKGLVFTDGPQTTEQRKFALRAFKGDGFSKSQFEFNAQEEISKFLLGLANRCRMADENNQQQKRGGKFKIDHFFRLPVLNSLWVSIIGHRLNEDEPTLKNLNEILARITDTSSSLRAQLSFFYPWASDLLTFFGLNCVVDGMHTIYSFMGKQIEESRGNYTAGEPKNLTHAYFDQVSETTNPESSFYKGLEQRFTTGDLFLAASDTTSVSLDWLLLYMAREPHIQRKLQAEIDDVIGFDVEENGSPRTPLISDRMQMPYTEAVIKELLRISSIAPLAMFHRATEDFNFHGYRIPKDTMIVPNLYGIHHDPEIWSEPESFQPDRFLNGAAEAGDDGSTLKPAPAPAGLILPFSSGKRNCIGEGFARDQLFLITTSFFQKFTVSCTEKVPSVESDFGFVLAPLPFELIVSERDVLNNIS